MTIQNEAHQKLVKAILKTFGKNEMIFFWPNNTGTAYRRKELLKFGLKGSPDIIGMTNVGQFFGIEVKTGKAVLGKQQKAFRDRAISLGAHYLVARSVADVALFLDQICL